MYERSSACSSGEFREFDKPRAETRQNGEICTLYINRICRAGTGEYRYSLWGAGRRIKNITVSANGESAAVPITRAGEYILTEETAIPEGNRRLTVNGAPYPLEYDPVSRRCFARLSVERDSPDFKITFGSDAAHAQNDWTVEVVNCGNIGGAYSGRLEIKIGTRTVYSKNISNEENPIKICSLAPAQYRLTLDGDIIFDCAEINGTLSTVLPDGSIIVDSQDCFEGRSMLLRLFVLTRPFSALPRLSLKSHGGGHALAVTISGFGKPCGITLRENSVCRLRMPVGGYRIRSCGLLGGIYNGEYIRAENNEISFDISSVLRSGVLELISVPDTVAAAPAPNDFTLSLSAAVAGRTRRFNLLPLMLRRTDDPDFCRDITLPTDNSVISITGLPHGSYRLYAERDSALVLLGAQVNGALSDMQHDNLLRRWYIPFSNTDSASTTIALSYGVCCV